MRLRTVLLLLAGLALISTIGGGLYYYFSVRESAFDQARRRASWQTALLETQVSEFLSENLNPVKTLAGMEQIRQGVGAPSPGQLAETNAILDHFQTTLGVDVCYLMNRNGLTIASSNRNAPDSFLGVNFEFRPYFQSAIRGKPALYLALGSTSGKRGVYFSHPVLVPDQERPAGVVVIKSPIQSLEDHLLKSVDGIVLLVSPDGVIFSSNRPDWLFKTLWSIRPEEVEALTDSRQFGKGPWPWVGLRSVGEHLDQDPDGRQFLSYSKELNAYPGWRVVHLTDLGDLAASLFQPLLGFTTWLVIYFCTFTGLAVFFLYRKASQEITRRKKAEAQVLMAKEQLSLYSKDLERQVRERTKEIRGLLRNIPAVVNMKDAQGRYVLVNRRYEALFGQTEAEVKGKTVFDIFPVASARVFHRHDMIVLQSKTLYQAEERIPNEEGGRVYLSVRFPLLDESGEVSRLCAISVDISDLKQAQDELRRLSTGIIQSQEKERTAIARELHDELGQILTALRMDAVWLKERIKTGDALAAERAEAMCRMIDGTITEVGAIATRLRPALLDDLGLVDALEWQTADFEKRTGIVCVYNVHCDPDLSETVSVAVFRIAQEALTNVARHSGATHVEVTLAGEQDRLFLTVKDNGRGFKTDEIPEREGLGLAGMRERANLIGGELNIRSVPDEGTEIRLKFHKDQER